MTDAESIKLDELCEKSALVDRVGIGLLRMVDKGKATIVNNEELHGKLRTFTTGPRGGKTLKMLQAERIRVLDRLKAGVESIKDGAQATIDAKNSAYDERNEGEVWACETILALIEELRK